ncbi:Aste57867_17506 [Aphanomyces stellatus]|uniref:Aste57867_17506 protein n=1 Tax=Aphanomyces stellatus TaxID=120398 RepID=A0A485L975_9STRA|nr:hypothetical protein As57867_017446 [Aphanomyces stellatus]VFT94259.1 Aste57867_17506 [Aphanomyces stellatus]
MVSAASWMVALVAATAAAASDSVHLRVKHGAVNDHQRVIGGTPAETGLYPWMVGVRFKADGDAFCGGSLIAPNYVLTAAHCVYFRHAAPSVIYVTIGSSLINGTSDAAGEEYRAVANYTLHPQFQSAVTGYDFALLQLNQSSTKTPIPLGLHFVPANTSTTLMGWGQMTPDSGSNSYRLLQATLSVLEPAACQARIRASNDSMYTSWTANDSQLCAGGVNGTGSCYGDSGGPLVAKKTANRTLVLVGDVSFGVTCGTGIPDVYGRVSVVKDWIDGFSKGHTWL